MRFLADESCDFAAVRALRAVGHDVLAVAQVKRGLPDQDVIDLAVREQRLLLTEDRDFGQLVYAHARRASGVIYIRYPSPARPRLGPDVVTLVATHGERLIGSFVVMQPGRIRVGRPASESD